MYKFPTHRPDSGSEIKINYQGCVYYGVSIDTYSIKITEKPFDGPLHIGYVLDSNFILYWELKK
jgi:hypothetical protein